MQRTVLHRHAATAMTEARRSLASGDLATAERVCAQVLAGTPDCGDAWAVLTETALQRDRPDAGIVCANRAVALTPGDPITHILRAKCLFVCGEAGQAFAVAETASSLIGSAPEALDALGAIFGLLGLQGLGTVPARARCPPAQKRSFLRGYSRPCGAVPRLSAFAAP
jgi:predicted Zn-dependent protease